MDLVTLVAACALTVDPKLMHALIWHQSGGEPWSFSVTGERQPQVYRSAREAVREAQTAVPQGVPIRVGLTGLAAEFDVGDRGDVHAVSQHLDGGAADHSAG